MNRHNAPSLLYHFFRVFGVSWQLLETNTAKTPTNTTANSSKNIYLIGFTIALKILVVPLMNPAKNTLLYPLKPKSLTSEIPSWRYACSLLLHTHHHHAHQHHTTHQPNYPGKHIYRHITNQRKIRMMMPANGSNRWHIVDPTQNTYVYPLNSS